MKSKLHAAVQNMKSALQPTNEVKDTTQKKPDQKKIFTNRENVPNRENEVDIVTSGVTGAGHRRFET